MKKKLIFIGLFLLMGLQLIYAQTRLVTGTVTSADDGGILIGISVIVKGTTVGAATDAQGKYSINVPSTATTLVFSFIGMKTLEVPIVGSIMDVIMTSDITQLEEVVVVAYGTATKESLTGAVSAVNATAIEKRSVSTVTGVLEGLSTGVQVNNTFGEPGSEPSIRIRGFTTISGSNSPLYVIDGVPFSGNISDLNPQDIESMTVLKDAASSALFGNRASNGVIMITTKKGKSDKITFRASASNGFYSRGIKEYDRLNPDNYMEVMWKGYRNSLLTTQPLLYPTEALANAQASSALVSTYLGYNIYNQADNQLFDANGKLNSNVSILPGYDDLDWFKYIERVGHRQEYSVNADAATDNSSFYLSAGYLDEKGYIKSSDFQRFTGRTNISLSPKKWFKTGLTMSASHQVSNFTTGDGGTTIVNPFYFARNIAPIYPVYLHNQTTGEYLLDEQGNKIYNDGDGRPQLNGRHTIWENELNMDRTYRNTMQTIGFFDVNFLEDFTFTVKGDMNIRNSDNQTYNNAIIGDGAGNKGRASTTLYRYKNYTFMQQLLWKKKFDRHNVDVLLAHENYSWNRAYKYGYKTTEVFANGTELINFTDITRLTGYQDDYRTESYLTRARYNYDSKYFFDASFRRDGSSRFYSENRWGNFWSTGASWIISKEDFMDPLKGVVNSLKLRASYGEVGNDNVNSYYAYMALYTMNQNANLGALYKVQNEAMDLLWETSSSFGTALEGRVFDRLNFSVEYFDKRSQNLLFDVNLPLSAGATSTGSAESVITKNLGTIANQGIEFSVDADIIQNSDFRWNLGLNLTTYKNTIKSLPEQNREDGIISGTKRYLEGHGIYDFWMYQFIGVDQMTGMSLYTPDWEAFHVAEYDGGGVLIPVEDKTPIPEEHLVRIGDKYYTTFTTYAVKDWSGSAIPDFFGSISTSLTYKDFSLSVLGVYSIGGKTIDYSYSSLMSVIASPSALHSDLLNSWDGIPDGMTATSSNRIDPNGIPRIDYYTSSYTNATSTRFLQDASYFVIKNISLSYNLPAKIANKLDVAGASVNLSVENLATFTSLQGMNPQYSFAGTSDNAFVTARVFSMGLNLRF